MIELILGGARSGKSAYAQKRAIALANRASPAKQVIYIATATAVDQEMRERIARHQADRPGHWLVHEQPLDLWQVLQEQGQSPEHLLLVDCLTLWLNNELYQRQPQDFALFSQRFLRTLSDCEAQVLLVANEVGLGVVPMGEVTRQFVDWAGWLNQAVAAKADKVTLITAGLPLILKGDPA